MKKSKPVWDLLGIRTVGLERRVKQLEEDLKAEKIDNDEIERRLRALEYHKENPPRQY